LNARHGVIADRAPAATRTVEATALRGNNRRVEVLVLAGEQS
jgi:hypothetical protein